MNREEKSDLEYAIGKSFIETLGGLEDETLIHDDNPDFFIKSKSNKQIGIELTQIYNKINQNQNRAKVEGSRDKLLVKLKQIWDSSGLPPSHINLIFASATPVSYERLDKLAIQIINLVQVYIPNQGLSFRSPDSMIIKIPNINGFSIERICQYTESLWSFHDSIWPQNLKIDIIQNTINTKEKKRIKYLERCDVIWLVIAIYGGRASGSFEIPSETINHKFEHNFDRLFLFDTLSKKNIELKR